MRIGRGTLGRLIACLSIGSSICAGLGACDDQSEVPAELVQQTDPQTPEPPTPEPATRPTTQELVESPRVTIKLDELPLTLQVPLHWTITRRSVTSGSLVWLEGPAPAGDVQIGLKVQDSMLPQKFDQLLLGTRREIERKADPNTQLTVKQLGPTTIIERRNESLPFEAKAIDKEGNPIRDASGVELTRTVTPMRWRVSVYVPREGQVDHYELNFIDLEKPQYDADRAFLEDILKTLRYTGGTAGGGGTGSAGAGDATSITAPAAATAPGR